MRDKLGVIGTLHVLLTGPDGEIKSETISRNLVTTVGDEYYARMALAGLGSNVAPTDLVDGMKLGTNTSTEPTKSGAGSFIATGDYVAGSNVAVSASAVAVAGTNNGWKAVYTAVWDAGTATATIGEVHLCTDQATDDTSTHGASAVIARSLLSTPKEKGESDTLTITWSHTFLGQ